MNPAQVVFAFFDEASNKQIKINMAAKLLSFQKISDDDDDDESTQEERIVNAKQYLKEAHSFLDKEVDYFITQQTFNFSKGSTFQLISFSPRRMFGKKTWIF